jgi:pyruvate/2-oxoglutarate dehydrogenase complex dihydrolipoamide acyltransferase (E2) component
MKALRRALIVPAIAALVVLASGGAALAQTSIQITVTPVRTDGGWIYWLAFLSLALALLLVIFLIAAYMRYAPRFAKDEDEAKVVRADRVLPGQAPPRRMVDVTKAVPVVAAPPPVVVAAAPAAAAPAPAASAAAAPAPAAAAPAPAAPAAAVPAPAAARRPRRRRRSPLRPSTSRSRWIKRCSTRRSRSSSRPAPTGGSPKARRDVRR